MKLLLDENLPHALRSLLIGHDVYSVEYMKWRGTKNGELLKRAASAGFDALLSMDRGLEFEQNLATLPCSVVLIRAAGNAIDDLRPLVPIFLSTLRTMQPRSLMRVGD